MNSKIGNEAFASDTDCNQEVTWVDHGALSSIWILMLVLRTGLKQRDACSSQPLACLAAHSCHEEVVTELKMSRTRMICQL